VPHHEADVTFGPRNGLCDDLGDGTLHLEYPGVSSMPDRWNDAVRSFVCVDSAQE